jgi:hypothetical protein
MKNESLITKFEANPDENDDVRDSMVFYRRHYEGIKYLPDSEFVPLIKCIFEYAFYEKEIELTGLAMNLFQNFIKPQIDANKRKYIYSKKGGRPKKNTNNQESNNDQ